MSKLGPRDEEAADEAFRSAIKASAGMRLKGWHSLKPDKALPSEARMLRRALGLSQKEFAEILGASVATVQAWESGKQKPDGVATKVLRLLDQDHELVQRFAATHLP